MNKREFITLLGGAAAAWPLGARAQQAAKPAVGFLFPGPHANMLTRVEAMLNGLHGTWPQVELILRASDGDPARIAPFVAEIVKSKVDVILATGPEVLQAFRSATTTIPIIAWILNRIRWVAVWSIASCVRAETSPACSSTS